MLRDKSAAPREARFHPSPLHALKRLLSASALGAGLILAAGGAVAQAQPSPSSPSVEGQGKRFFDKVCAKCHEAGIGPVITGRGLDPVVYTTIVRHGNRAMPAFRVTDIDDATLQDLAVYLSKTPAKP
jgi:mono/diheme cytochrome c family protein